MRKNLNYRFAVLAAVIAFAAIVFAGCTSSENIIMDAVYSSEPTAVETAEENAANAEAQTVSTQEDYVPASDDNSVSITMSGSDAVVDGTGAQAAGSHVTITGGGTYTVSGETADGSVTVNAPGEEITLVLDGTSITNSQGPAILVEDAAEMTLTIQDGTENTLQDGGESEYDGALYSVPSYTINGTGTLTVNGTVEEGIAGEMHLVIDGPTIDVTAPDDGMNANNDNVSEITINSGMITITAGGDGIDSNGSITINGGTVLTCGSVDDMSGGLDADGDITINGGTVLSTGAAAPQPADGSQNYIAYTLDSTLEAGSAISLRGDDTEVFSATITNSAQTVFFSDASVTEGVEYELYADDTLAGTASTETSAATGGFAPGGMGGAPPEGFDGGTPPEGFDGESMPNPPASAQQDSGSVIQQVTS